MTEQTEKLPCPECSRPVTLPVHEDLTYEEKLCIRCHKELEIHEECAELIERMRKDDQSTV